MNGASARKNPTKRPMNTVLPPCRAKKASTCSTCTRTNAIPPPVVEQPRPAQVAAKLVADAVGR